MGYAMPRLIRTMETSMHGSLDRSGQADGNVRRGWRIAFFALPVLILVALVGLAVTHPGVAGWISEAMQAEFTAANGGADFAPTQLARPAGEPRTVGAN
jgi:hypothetical protein